MLLTSVQAFESFPGIEKSKGKVPIDSASSHHNLKRPSSSTYGNINTKQIKFCKVKFSVLVVPFSVPLIV